MVWPNMCAFCIRIWYADSGERARGHTHTHTKWYTTNCVWSPIHFHSFVSVKLIGFLNLRQAKSFNKKNISFYLLLEFRVCVFPFRLNGPLHIHLDFHQRHMLSGCVPVDIVNSLTQIKKKTHFSVFFLKFGFNSVSVQKYGEIGHNFPIIPFRYPRISFGSKFLMRK